MIHQDDPAPDFRLPATGGEVELSDLCREGAVILVFFVEASTPDCQRQLQPFVGDYSTIRELGAQVLAISADPLARLEAFAEKIAAPFPLASDHDLTVAHRYGIADKVEQKIKRALCVVGSNGKVLHINRDYVPANPAEYEAAVMTLAG